MGNNCSKIFLVSLGSNNCMLVTHLVQLLEEIISNDDKIAYDLKHNRNNKMPFTVLYESVM